MRKLWKTWELDEKLQDISQDNNQIKLPKTKPPETVAWTNLEGTDIKGKMFQQDCEFPEECPCYLDTASVSYCLLFHGWSIFLWKKKHFLKIWIQNEGTDSESRQPWYFRMNFPYVGNRRILFPSLFFLLFCDMKKGKYYLQTGNKLWSEDGVCLIVQFWKESSEVM